MNTQYSDLTNTFYYDAYWFDFGMRDNYSAPSTPFGDWRQIKWQRDVLENTIDDLLVDRAKLYRTATASIRMLTTALRALDKNKTHITADHIERVIDDLTAAIAYADTNPDQ